MSALLATDTSVTGLDHAGFIVQDLDAASDLMARLGFSQTVRADHTRTNSVGELVSAGSSQHSVMLRYGYIELMQITDPHAGHQLTPATHVRHGLHVIALGTDDAAHCHALRAAAGVAVGPLLNWSRPMREGVCQGMARFCYFDSRWDAHDPSYLCWVQHLTPELMRPAPLLRHDNGALALRGVQYRGPRLQAQAWARQLALAGASAMREHAGGVDVAFVDARFEVMMDDSRQAVLPTALVLEFSGLDGLRQRCVTQGIAATVRADGALEIDLDRHLGLHLICVQAPG